MKLINLTFALCCLKSDYLMFAEIALFVQLFKLFNPEHLPSAFCSIQISTPFPPKRRAWEEWSRNLNTAEGRGKMFRIGEKIKDV